MTPQKKTSGVRADNLIALPGGLSTEACGAMIWWKLDGDVRAVDLEAAWKEQGLDENWLPSLPGAKVALSRAVDDVIKGNSARKKHRVNDAHWMVYEVKADEKESGFVEQLRVTLDENKLPVVSPKNHPLAVEIHQRFHAHRNRLEAKDISYWLSNTIGERLNGVTLRPQGALYFVDRDHIKTFEKVRDALRNATSHHMFEMKALKDDEAVKVILFGLIAEAEAQAKAIEADLDAQEDETNEDKLGPRALKTRRARAEAMITKVEAYEKLLDQSLEDIRARLEELAVASMEAAMLAEAENKEKK